MSQRRVYNEKIPDHKKSSEGHKQFDPVFLCMGAAVIVIAICYGIIYLIKILS